jgi:hypothetical protein
MQLPATKGQKTIKMALFKFHRFTRFGIFSALLLTSMALLSGCLMESGNSDSGGQQGTGYVRFSLELSRTDRALMKSASADTLFSLDSAIVILTAPGAPDQVFRYPISGRADLASITATSPVYELAPLRNWKAKIITIDTTVSPLRRDTVHLDSVSFSVRAGDTTEVSALVRPVYSILRVRFLSTAPDSLPTGVRYVRLRVHGRIFCLGYDRVAGERCGQPDEEHG